MVRLWAQHHRLTFQCLLVGILPPNSCVTDPEAVISFDRSPRGLGNAIVMWIANENGHPLTSPGGFVWISY